MSKIKIKKTEEFDDYIENEIIYNFIDSEDFGSEEIQEIRKAINKNVYRTFFYTPVDISGRLKKGNIFGIHVELKINLSYMEEVILYLVAGDIIVCREKLNDNFEVVEF